MVQQSCSAKIPLRKHPVAIPSLSHHLTALQKRTGRLGPVSILEEGLILQIFAIISIVSLERSE